MDQLNCNATEKFCVMLQERVDLLTDQLNKLLLKDETNKKVSKLYNDGIFTTNRKGELYNQHFFVRMLIKNDDVVIKIHPAWNWKYTILDADELFDIVETGFSFSKDDIKLVPKCTGAHKVQPLDHTGYTYCKDKTIFNEFKVIQMIIDTREIIHQNDLIKTVYELNKKQLYINTHLKNYYIIGTFFPIEIYDITTEYDKIYFDVCFKSLNIFKQNKVTNHEHKYDLLTVLDDLIDLYNYDDNQLDVYRSRLLNKMKHKSTYDQQIYQCVDIYLPSKSIY